MARVGRARHPDLLSRIGAGALAIAAAGCGLIPGTDLSDSGLPIQVGRGGLEVVVSVTGWDRPKTKLVMCAQPVSDDRLLDLVSTPVPRRDCLEMTTEHAGIELRGRYSFASASAVRRAAFDESPDWFVVLVGLDQAAPRYTQLRIPGGPVEVR